MTVCVWINDDDDMILANTLLLLNSKESTQRQEKLRKKERKKEQLFINKMFLFLHFYHISKFRAPTNKQTNKRHQQPFILSFTIILAFDLVRIFEKKPKLCLVSICQT